MHMEEAEALGLDLKYRLFDAGHGDFAAKDLGALLDRLAAEGYAGVNVTHPFKQDVLAHLDAVSADVEALGAVNTVVFSEGRKIGHNTDWMGWSKGFLKFLPGAGLDHALLLGAGGAGSAVAFAALKLGVGKLTLFDIDTDQTRDLAGKLAKTFGPDRIAVAATVAEVIGTADGLINTTPIGMAQYPGAPIDLHLLRPNMWVAEVIYFPLETPLLAHARRIGCRTVGGGPMVVYQAAEAFCLFTGVRPDEERMFQAFTRSTVIEA